MTCLFLSSVILGSSKITISFTKADVIVVIDSIDDRAAIAVWNREDLERHRLLRPD